MDEWIITVRNYYGLLGKSVVVSASSADDALKRAGEVAVHMSTKTQQRWYVTGLRRRVRVGRILRAAWERVLAGATHKLDKLRNTPDAAFAAAFAEADADALARSESARGVRPAVIVERPGHPRRIEELGPEWFLVRKRTWNVDRLVI